MLALSAMVALASACGATTTLQSKTSPLPGQGKPTIVLGGKGSPEQLLLGELYAQAFRAQGYVVVLEPNVGDTEQINTAFQSGRIQAYPEDLGDLATTDAGHSAPVASEGDTELIDQQYELAHGGTIMMPVTPFSDTGELVTLASFAKQRNLTTIEQLKALPFHLKFGDYAGQDSEYAGYAGLQQAYGLTNVEFVPLAVGTSIYSALDTHAVQLGDGLSTDPQLTAGTYAVLSDPKSIFGFHHVALIIQSSLLSRLGPEFGQIYSAVTDLLTLSAIQALTKEVAVDGQMPAAVAHEFLLANRLVAA